jgi:hypothetical protein
MFCGVYKFRLRLIGQDNVAYCTITYDSVFEFIIVYNTFINLSRDLCIMNIYIGFNSQYLMTKYHNTK